MEVETTREAYAALETVPFCHKNPNHVGFHSLSELNVDILPEEIRNEEYVSFIQFYSQLVVRLTVVDRDNDDTLLHGSGYVLKDIDSDTLYIQTNHHVVESQKDVQNCKIDFFYNTTDMKGIENSYGLNLKYCSEEKDICRFTFHPVPQKIRELMSVPIVKPTSTNHDNIIVISHPHGGPKKITIGKYLSGEVDERVSKHMYTAPTCPGSSGGLVLNMRWSYRPSDWVHVYFHFTHFAGKRRKEYKGMLVETSNINQSVWNYS